MKRQRYQDLDPDDIFLDASNLGDFDTSRLQGRVERPVSRTALFAVGIAFTVACLVFGYQVVMLQVVKGDAYALAAQANRLAHSLVFAERGVIYDRTGEELAWNEPGDTSYASRTYTPLSGLSHLLGYVQYPREDDRGLWWRTEYKGIAGAESIFDTLLGGVNGKEIVEVDARGTVTRGSIVETPQNGGSVTLSIDAELQHQLYDILARHAQVHGFIGAASVIMDVRTGELLALTSFPEFSSQALTDADQDALAAFNADPHKPFVDRAVAGQYTPGSIVKPLFAAAALQENIISSEKAIYSPGYITIPNPYNPDQPTIMKDWRAHGWTTMREAIAVSSDVYFYAIGGGYEDQRGLGITQLDVYARKFGLGSMTGIPLEGESEGVIPTPEWKAKIFDGDDWRLGDTYNTSIGQYGFQVTPIQMVRAVAAIANGGQLMLPQLVASSTPETTNTGVEPRNLKVVREGMRLAVTSDVGTARSLNMQGIQLAGKTGTAELGSRKQFMNSWVVGFWPADNPRYAFATVLERAPAGTLSGAAPAMRPFFEWLLQNRPEYVEY